MNDSKWTWRAVGLVSILATLLLITGFVYAVSDIINPKGETLLSSLPQETAAPTAAATDELKILALGDSLAKGTGDNSGQGFVKRTLEALSADGGKAELLGNMGINGLTTAGLQSKLQEEGVQYALRQANVILISIGGNDLFRGSDILGTGSSSGEAVSSADTENPADGIAPLETESAANNTVEGSAPVPTASTDELTPNLCSRLCLMHPNGWAVFLTPLPGLIRRHRFITWDCIIPSEILRTCWFRVIRL